MSSELNLFPTFTTLDLDAPSLLCKEVDAAGRTAAVAFDEMLTAAGLEPTAPHQAPEATLKQALGAFARALEDEPGLPRAVRRCLVRNMPRAWDRIVLDARQGRLSSAVLLLEADARNRADEDGDAADFQRHPITAYLDDTGSKAAERAFAAHKAALRAGKTRAEADSAAQKALFGELAKKVGRDLIDWLEELDRQGFWIVAATAAAGVLASFIVAPRTLLATAAGLGAGNLPISHDFDVATIGDHTKVRIGLQVTALTGALAQAETWTDVFNEGFAAGASLGLDFGASQLTARAQVSPGSWGLRIGFRGTFG